MLVILCCVSLSIPAMKALLRMIPTLVNALLRMILVVVIVKTL